METSPRGVRGSSAPRGSSSPSLLEILNPFEPSTIPRGAGEIASKAGSAGHFVASSKAQEQLGEELGHEAQKAAEGALPSIGGLPWLQIIELVGGGALVIFGLTALAQRVKA